jgi:hypothetical protein
VLPGFAARLRKKFAIAGRERCQQRPENEGNLEKAALLRRRPIVSAIG